MRIRFPEGFLPFFVLVLGLLYGGREIPEIFSLADDVSNDGAVIGVVYSGSARSAYSLPRNKVESEACLRVLKSDYYRAKASPSLVPQLQTGRSLLQLLCLERR